MKVKLLIIIAVLVFVGVGFGSANGEVLTHRSAVVWRQDGLGDYLLPQEFSLKRYESGDTIYTEGEVSSITVNWKAFGSVLLEVSFDNGINYVSVVNGVPLDIRGQGSRVKGHAIKWKAYLLEEDSILNEVKVTYFDTSGVIGGFGNEQLSGFKYRKPITIVKNDKGESLFNYQVKLAVSQFFSDDADIHCDGNVLADFSDVRFTAADGLTSLPYYIESISGTELNRIAWCFVKVPQIPSNGVIIYIYYGNRVAVSLSDAFAVFDFYDNFSNSVIDDEKWDIKMGPQGKAYVYDSDLFIEDAQVRSKTFEFKGGIIEYSAKAVKGNEIALIIRDQNFSFDEDTAQVAYSSAFIDAQHCIATRNFVRENIESPILSGIEYNYRIIADDDSIIFQRYSQGFIDKQTQVSYKDSGGIKKGCLGVKAKNSSGTENLTVYKWIRVRKRAKVIPVVSSYAKSVAQEVVHLAEFSNTKIKENGNLILSESSVIGNYVSPYIRSQFMIRILIPYYKIKNGGSQTVRFDFSTNKGASFYNDCVNGQYYYSSKNDFNANNMLGYRFLFKNLKGKRDALEVESVTLEYSPGYISLVYPNGDEILSGGRKEKITWSAMEYDSSYPIKLEYSLDMGKTYELISEDAKNTGSFLWRVPKEYSAATVVKVSDSLDGDIFDISDKIFSIARGVTLARKGELGKQPILFKQDADKEDNKKDVLVSGNEIDLSAFIDSGEVMRSDVKSYELLVKVEDRKKGQALEDGKVRYEDGEIIVIKRSGHQWSVTEKEKFLVIKVYLTEDEAAQVMVKSIDTGFVDDEGKPILKNRKVTVNMEMLGLIGKSLSEVNRVLEKNVLIKDVLSVEIKEQKVEQELL
ncbi:MAG: DUF2341 domain-containing protein [Candidatus Omnitrophota bacterium]